MSRGKRLPYPGLRAFTREESDLFFGRDGCVDSMVDRLAATRFLAVLGSSGSGKSSLVRTGLLEALGMGLHPWAGSRWTVADFHPGGQPMQNLAAALLSSNDSQPPDSGAVDLLSAFLRRGPRSLAEWVSGGNLPPGTNLLLLVDQFEELFRYGSYARQEEAEAFVALLIETASLPGMKIHVVVTMRSEFLGACALMPGLAEKINAGLYLTPRMTREECRQAIEGPAGVMGFTVEPALVNRLLNDLASFAPWEAEGDVDQAERLARRADQLPLMQHVLNRLWARAGDEAGPGGLILRLSDYDGLGGLSGAIDAHGNEVLAALGETRARLAEAVFRSLVTGASVAVAVRRPTRLQELIEVCGSEPDTLTIVEAFSAPDCNFLRTSEPRLSGSVIVDITHESLIRQWTLLREWLEKEIRDGAAWKRLAAAQERYSRGEGGLLTGLDLQSLASWWQTASPTAEWSLRHGGRFYEVDAYLRESQEAEEIRSRAELKRLSRERTRLRIYAGSLLAVLIIGVYSTWIDRTSLSRLKDAKQKTEQAESDKKEAEAKKRKAIEETDRAQAEAKDAEGKTLDARAALAAALNMKKDAVVAAKDALVREHEAEENAKQAEAHEQTAIAHEQTATAKEQEAAKEKKESESNREQAERAKADTARMKDQLEKAQQQATQPGALGNLLTFLNAVLSPSGVSEDRKSEDRKAVAPNQTDLSVASQSAPASPAVRSESGKPGERHGKRSAAGKSTSESEAEKEVPAELDRNNKVLQADKAQAGSFAESYKQAEELEARGEADKALDKYGETWAAGLGRIKSLAPGEKLSQPDAAVILDAGYDYAWFQFDNRRDEVGERVMSEMDAVVRLYPEQTASPDLLRAFAQIENLKSRRASEHNDSTASHRHFAESLRLADLARAASPSRENTDFLYRELKNVAFESEVAAEEKNKDLARACLLADEMFADGPLDRKAISAKVECLREGAEVFSRELKFDEAEKELEQARDIVSHALDSDAENQRLLLLMTGIEIDLGTVFSRKSDSSGHDREDIRAKNYFIKALRDKLALENFRGEIKFLYQSLNNVTFKKSDADASYSEEELNFYKDIAGALLKSVRAFPSNESFAFVAADADAHVGGILRKDPQGQVDSEEYLSESIRLFNRSGTMENLKTFSEDPYAECSAYWQMLELHVAAKDGKASISDLRKMESTCEPALKAYPFDFYLREYFWLGNMHVGKLLVDLGKSSEAAEFLKYASDWGVGDSTKLLAEMYRNGHGVAKDEGRAKELDTLASRQESKRFTIQADFGGVTAPFNFYVREWPAEYPFKGIDDQIKWLKEARGGTVAETVAEAFRKLQQIAADNKVSYAALCDYALNTPDKPTDKDSKASTDAKSASADRGKEQYDKAESLYKLKKWAEAALAAENALKLDPKSTDALGLANQIYHEKLFRFDRAFELSERRVKLGSGVDDFVENHLTTSRFPTCATLAAVVKDQSSEKRIQIVMSSFEFACLSGAKKGSAALDSGRRLRAELAGLEKVKWTFTGTKHFVSQSPAFASKAPEWVNLFDALEQGDEKKAQAALTALGVPEEPKTSAGGK